MNLYIERLLNLMDWCLRNGGFYALGIPAGIGTIIIIAKGLLGEKYDTINRN